MKKRKNIKKRILITILLAVIASVLGILGISLLNKDIDNINYVASLLNRGEGEVVNIEDNSEITVEVLRKFFTFDGTEKTPVVTVKYGDEKLNVWEDYKLTYSNNTEVGTATIKIEGKGNYTGIVEETFKIRDDYGSGTKGDPWEVTGSEEHRNNSSDNYFAYAYMEELEIENEYKLYVMSNDIGNPTLGTEESPEEYQNNIDKICSAEINLGEYATFSNVNQLKNLKELEWNGGYLQLKNTTPSLKRIVFGKDVERFYYYGDENLYSSNNKIEFFEVDPGNRFLSSVDGVLFDANGEKLLYFPRCYSETSYTVPNSVKSIEEKAFYDCDKLEKVVIEGDIMEIPSKCFSGCDNLKGIDLGETVVLIGENAFWMCKSLETVSLPESIERIEKSAFRSCSKLTAVELPEGLEEIGDSAFESSGLTSVDFPTSLKVLGNSAFESTYIKEIHIPRNVSEIGSRTFSTRVLENITVEEENENFIADEGVLYDKNETILKQYPKNKKGESYSLPDSVETVGEYAFSGQIYLNKIILNEGLLKIEGHGFASSNVSSIEIPDSVTELSNNAFSFCSGLIEVTLGTGLKVIGSNAFSQCSKLEDLILPENVETVGNSAFSSKESGLSLTVLGKNVEFGENIFGNLTENKTIIGYKGSTAETYANENGITFQMFDEVTYAGLEGNETDGYLKMKFKVESSTDKTIRYKVYKYIDVGTTDYQVKTIQDYTECQTNKDIIINIAGLSSIDGYIYVQIEGFDEEVKVKCHQGIVQDNIKYKITKHDEDGNIVQIESLNNEDKKEIEELYIQSEITYNEERYKVVFPTYTMNLTNTSASTGVKLIKLKIDSDMEEFATASCRIECETIEINKKDDEKIQLIDGVLYYIGEDTKKLLVYPNEKNLSTYEVKENTTEIASKALTYNTSLKKVILPESLKEIDIHCFDVKSEENNETEVMKVIVKGSSCEKIKASGDYGNNQYTKTSTIIYLKYGTKTPELSHVKAETNIKNYYEIKYKKGENIVQTNYKIEDEELELLTTDEGYTGWYNEKDNAKVESLSEIKENVILYEVKNLESIEIKLENGLEEEVEENKNYIKNIKPNVTIEELIKNITTNKSIEILDKDNNVITDKTQIIKTGMKVQIKDGAEIIKEYVIVVKGDLLGEGKATYNSLLKLARYKAGLDSNLKGEYLKATDLTGNGKYAENGDLLKMARVLAGLDTY